MFNKINLYFILMLFGFLVSCGKSDPQMSLESETANSTSTIAPTEDLIFAAQYEKGQILTYKIDPQGQLTQIDTVVADNDSSATSLYLGKNDSLYLGMAVQGVQDENLYHYKINENNSLSLFEKVKVNTPDAHPHTQFFVSSMYESPNNEYFFAFLKSNGTHIFTKNLSNQLVAHSQLEILASLKNIRPSVDLKYMSFQKSDTLIFWPLNIESAQIVVEGATLSIDLEAYDFIDNDSLILGKNGTLSYIDFNVEDRTVEKISDVYWGTPNAHIYNISIHDDIIIAAGRDQVGGFVKSFKIAPDKKLSLVDSVAIEQWPQKIVFARSARFAVVSTRSENKLYSIQINADGTLEKKDELTLEQYLFDMVVK